MSNNVKALEQIIDQAAEILNYIEQGEEVANVDEKVREISEEVQELYSSVFEGVDLEDEDEDDEDEDEDEGEEMEEALSFKQKKHLDKNKNGRLDAHDFKLLRKESALDEAKRGRPKKGAEGESNVEPLSIQLQKRSHPEHVSVTFHDKATHSIPRGDANKALKHLSAMKPTQRDITHQFMSKSHDNFKKVLGGHVVKPETKGISLAGSVKEETISEADQKMGKFRQLAQQGLVDKEHFQKVINAYQIMKAGKTLSMQQRDLLLTVLGDLTDFVTTDSTVFQKARTTFSKAAKTQNESVKSDLVSRAVGYMKKKNEK